MKNLDSDDSDTEGGLGNVERVVMRPPGHSGKAKRGHLCFDASFETGKTNVKLKKINDGLDVWLSNQTEMSKVQETYRNLSWSIQAFKCYLSQTMNFYFI